MTERLYAACDPYDHESLLTDAERDVLWGLRRVLDEQAHPLLAEYWDRAEFPTQLMAPLHELDLMAPHSLTASGVEPRGLYHAFRVFELARTDASLATYYTGQAGLFRTAVREGGSPEQVARWDREITSWRMRGVFALTEPDHGSDVAGGLTTTATRTGDTWVLNGAKRWIGTATFSEYLAVFARDTADQQVKGFLVRTDAPGVHLDVIANKAALRMVQNAHITLTDVTVAEEFRLQRCTSFKDVARMLRRMRSDVAWIAAGVQAGAYEAALRYTTERTQFGWPIAGFQLVQEKLARILGNITGCLGLLTRLSVQQDAGVYRDEDSALAKSWCAARMRESVALAREVCGGNGITLDTDVARFFADAEAVYSYEGTHEINSLIVGRAITGLSAFTH